MMKGFSTFAAPKPIEGISAQLMTEIYYLNIKHLNEVCRIYQGSDLQQLSRYFLMVHSGNFEEANEEKLLNCFFSIPRFNTLAYLMKKSKIIDDPRFGAKPPTDNWGPNKRKREEVPDGGEIFLAEAIEEEPPPTKKARLEID